MFVFKGRDAGVNNEKVGENLTIKLAGEMMENGAI